MIRSHFRFLKRMGAEPQPRLAVEDTARQIEDVEVGSGA
jgi:hypothetical protein